MLQTVYVPINTNYEFPESKDSSDVEVLFQYKGVLYLGWFNPNTKIFSTYNGISEYYSVVDLWFKPKEVFVFTPEQLNEHTAYAGELFIKTVAEAMTDYNSDLMLVLDKQSILNTFEEVYSKFKLTY